MSITKPTKPKEQPEKSSLGNPRRKRVSKKDLQDALKASVDGGAQFTEEHREIIRTWEENPGTLLGLSKSEYLALGKTSEIIHKGGSEDQELLVAAQALILCGLPYKALVDDSGRIVTHYKRTARTARGQVSLIVAAADPDIPLPYGKDRAVLAWLQTKAKRQGNPKVTWSSATEFFEVFGIQKGGSGYKQFRETWRRLANAIFTIELETETHSKGKLIPLLEEWDLPTARDHRSETAGLEHLPGMQYYVTLSPTLWKHLQDAAVPLRLEVMRHFQDEPKGWDFVALICYRSWLCEQSQKNGFNSVARIPWEELRKQLGSGDSDEHRLRSTLRKILIKLKHIWPECQAELERGGTLAIKPPMNSIHPVKDR